MNANLMVERAALLERYRQLRATMREPVSELDLSPPRHGASPRLRSNVMQTNDGWDIKVTVNDTDGTVVVVLTNEDGEQRKCTLTPEEALQAGQSLIDKAGKPSPEKTIPAKFVLDE